MFKKYRGFTIVYILVFLLVLLATYLHIPWIIKVSRPGIFVVSMVFLVVSTALRGRFHQRLFFGIITSLVADMLFMFHSYDPLFLLYGSIALLLCHLLYISAFYLDFLSAKELDKKGARIAIACSAIIFSAFYFYIRPYLPLQKLPILTGVFIAALLLMMAAFRNQRVNKGSFNLIMAGAICFVITDALMAQVYFVKPFNYHEMIISAFYMVSQYLIIRGGVERKLIYQQTAL